MKRILSILAAASALAMTATPAQATDVVLTPNTVLIGVPDGLVAGESATFIVSGDPINGPAGATFSHGGIPLGNFTDTLLFTLGADGTGSGDATTSLALGGLLSSVDLDIISVFINGSAVNGIYTDANNNPCFTPNVGTCLNQKFSASNVPITAGALNTLVINGFARGSGQYGGTLTFVPNAVPEPGTWAMMLLGFGAIGFAMRRRRPVALAQLA